MDDIVCEEAPSGSWSFNAHGAAAMAAMAIVRIAIVGDVVMLLLLIPFP